VLLVLTPLASLSLVEREHGRTIPLTDIVAQQIHLTLGSSVGTFLRTHS